MIGVWLPQEVNRFERPGGTTEHIMGYALDYGFRSIDALLGLLKGCAMELASQPTTHLGVLCDQRAEEYAALAPLSDGESRMAFHTLPWIIEPLQEGILYCDAVYL